MPFFDPKIGTNIDTFSSPCKTAFFLSNTLMQNFFLNTYNVNRSNIQFWKDAEFWRKVIAQIGLGVWKGGTSSWGQGRILLEPVKINDMYGRSGFTIHGGADPYSKGCIDLVENEVDFLNDFMKIDKDMILEVEY